MLHEKPLKLMLTAVCLLCSLISVAQQEIPLYPVGTLGLSTDKAPSLSVFLPAIGNNSGKSVIICPGGGYQALVFKREGTDVALAFNEAGITAFVLKYRLPADSKGAAKWQEPLQDAQRALKLVREGSEQWKIDPNKVGMMGFSAGGHLASTAGTHFEKSVIENLEKTKLRPDFLILVYPVISFKEGIAHTGSRNRLIGPEQLPGFAERIEEFSNELKVTARTPPTFLTHAVDDTIVPLSNTLLFFEALNKHKVPVELHVYPRGEHGYLKYPAFADWFGNCLKWVADL